MYARVTISQTLPGTADAGLGIYRDSLVPAAKQQKGFKGAYLLSDRNTGKNLSITFWDTEADMLAGEASGYYQQQLAKFKDLLGAPPTREVYEVAVQA